MSRLFLGKWWHWVLFAASVGALWLAGHDKMHVVHFNAFVLSLLAATAVVVAIIVAGTRPGEQITRDRLTSDERSQSEATDTPRSTTDL